MAKTKIYIRVYPSVSGIEVDTEMQFVPRVGESVVFKKKLYTCRDITYNVDENKVYVMIWDK